MLIHIRLVDTLLALLQIALTSRVSAVAGVIGYGDVTSRSGVIGFLGGASKTKSGTRGKPPTPQSNFVIRIKNKTTHPGDVSNTGAIAVTRSRFAVIKDGGVFEVIG